jgi:Fuc2NAc and GlcNAc transferase
MLAAGLAAFVTTVSLTPALSAWARRRNFLDVPNQRSSHVLPTPRIGGAAIVVSVLVGTMVLYLLQDAMRSETMLVLGGAVVIAILGLVDDFRHLSAVLRLGVQILVAAATVITVGTSPLRGPSAEDPITAAVSVLWIVWTTNAYNFMDGIDGIAGGQAVVAGMGWVAVGLLVGTNDIAALGALVAASSSGFLVFNWHPAGVFMGDAGSGFLGFLLASLPLLAPQNCPAISVGVLLLWPFLFDTGFTLIRRAIRGQNVLNAHRAHLYQRLVQVGRSHAQVSVCYIGLALLGSAAAVSLVLGHSEILFGLCTTIAAAALILWWRTSAEETSALAGPGINRGGSGEPGA